MKHLRKNLTSLAVALVMTAALCAAVIFTGQNAAVAEDTAGNTVRSSVEEAPAADASGALAGAALPSPSPSLSNPLGPLTGAMKAKDSLKVTAGLTETAETAQDPGTPGGPAAQEEPEPKPEPEPEPKPEPQPEPKPEPQPEPEPEPEPKPVLPSSDTSVVWVGTVNSSGVRVRTAPVSGGIITNLNYGAVVSIYDLNDGWYKVGYDGKTGYMSADYVTARTSASDLTGYGRVETDALNLRTGPGSGYSSLRTVSSGAYVELTGFENGWYAVSYNGSSGYMSGDYLTPVVSKPAPKPEPTPDPDPKPDPEPTPAPPSNPSGSSIVDYAAQFVGVPYVYGGSSPYGFDCSGFTMYVFSHFGYSLPHGATGQFSRGSFVSQYDLQPGDLVFFYDPSYGGSGITATHVGIYAGGRQFIHASSYNGGVCFSSIDDPWYYSIFYVGARRLG